VIFISDIRLYNDPKPMEHIQALAFNRTASSTGETEALNYIESELIKNNIKPEVEHFSWAGPLSILMRTSYFLIVIALILFHMILLLITFFIIKYAFARLRRLSFITKEESKSIFTLIKSKNEIPKRPLVIITAHYDSISANLPYRLQVIIFFIYRLIVIFYAIIFFTFAGIFFLDLLRIIPVTNFLTVFISFSSVGGVFISIPILYLVFRERPSLGAIDNASGVAISIELAKIFNKNPLETTDIMILWPGAEEWGLKGSKAFCKNHFSSLKKIYDLDNSYNINIDMVGSYIGLLNKTGLVFRRKMNKNVNDVFGATAKQLNIPLKVYNKVISPKSDYKSLKKYAKKYRTKFQVSLIHSSEDSKYIHSLKDSPDKCSLESLNGCVEVLKKSQLTSAV
jgi:hypothetical protein